MTYRYIIPDVPPSNNLFIGRNNRWNYQKIKKHWADTINLVCRPKPPEPLNRARVTLSYQFNDKRRRAPDNYSGKMVLDGLVSAGIIKDDSFSCIDLVLKSAYGKTEQIEILIEDVENEKRN